MVTETDINEDLRTLAQDAENARLYGSPPDAIVLRAIELGMGTRAELRRSTGFGYDVIEKCLERLSEDISFQMVGQIERFHVIGKEPKPKVEYICVDCGGPKSSYPSVKRCRKCYESKKAENHGPPRPELDAQDRAHQEQSANGDGVMKEKQVGYVEFDREASPRSARTGKFGISVTAEVKKIVEAMPVGEEVDTPRLWNALIATHPALKSNPNQGDLRTYIAQAVTPLKGNLLEVVHKGRAGEPDLLRRIVGTEVAQEPEKNITETITEEYCFCGRKNPPGGRHRGTHRNKFAMSENGQKPVKIETKPRTEIAQPKSVEVVEPDKKQDKMLDVKMTPEQFIERFNSFDDYEIDQFFTLMNEKSAVDNVVWGVLPEEPKHSKQFFSVAYNVLVTMLDDEMGGEQKQSVWSLICYLKKQQKNVYG